MRIDGIYELIIGDSKLTCVMVCDNAARSFEACGIMRDSMGDVLRQLSHVSHSPLVDFRLEIMSPITAGKRNKGNPLALVQCLERDYVLYGIT